MTTTSRGAKTDPAFAPAADVDAILRMSPDDFERRVQRCLELCRELTSLLPAATPLTPEARQSSIGKLRKDEPAAMSSILDAVDAFPGLFASLATRDRGSDDAKVETAVLRRALACLTATDGLRTALAGLSESGGDL